MMMTSFSDVAYLSYRDDLTIRVDSAAQGRGGGVQWFLMLRSKTLGKVKK